MAKKEGAPQFSDDIVKARLIHDQEQHPEKWTDSLNETSKAQKDIDVFPLENIKESLQDRDVLYDDFMELLREVEPDATTEEALNFSVGLMSRLGITPQVPKDPPTSDLKDY